MLEQWREQYMIKLDKLCSDEIHKRTSLCESSMHDKIKQLQRTNEFNIHNFKEMALLEATQLRERVTNLTESQLDEHFLTICNRWPQSSD